MKLVAVPVLSACVCLFMTLPAVAAQGARMCGAGAIRAAAAKQVAPNLVGCRYDAVAVPLAQYFSIFPSLTKTAGEKASSTILQQAPAAGEPLGAGGQLALQVSVGPAGMPTAAPLTQPQVIAAPVANPTVPDTVADTETVPPAAVYQAPSSEVQTSKSTAQPLLPAYLLRPGLIWAWVGIIAAGVVVVLIWRARRPRYGGGYDRVPQVSARFVFGPSRLSASGPLVLKSGGET
ncbi:MAG: hypothetical protein QM647_14290 [Asticcacaulis sp.]|uniref:hypothetical protein n=1 Tax=Asticcacaulis sp. TaxID=1872648 RepID=UPI0039E546A8